MKMLLIRNAEHRGHEENRWPTDDTGLSREGVRQSVILCRHLASASVTQVISSPALRATQTIRLLAEQKKLPMQECADLKNLGMGDCTGLTHEETRTLLGLSAWEEAFRCPKDDVRYFKDGETLSELAMRAWRGVNQIVSEHGQNDNALVAVATHEEVIGVLLCKMTGMPLSRLWWWGGRLRPPLYANITEVLWRDGQWTLVHFGCTKHLAEL